MMKMTIREYSKDPNCIAVGECGLDYFRLPEDEKEKEAEIAQQKEVFQGTYPFGK